MNNKLLLRKDDVKNEAINFMKIGLLRSAENLLGLYLSSLSELKNGSDAELLRFSEVECEITETLGDIISKRRQYKRAYELYNKSLNFYQFVNQRKDGLFTSPLVYSGNSKNKVQNKSTTVNSLIPPSIDVVRIKYKLCLCQLKIYPKDLSAVIRELETIPNKMRDIKIHLLLGSLYKACSLKRLAIKSYREALFKCPASTEIVDALVNLGVSNEEISSTVGDGFHHRRGGIADEEQEDVTSSHWMKHYTSASVNKRDFDIDKSLICWRKLMESFPQSHLILKRTAAVLLVSAPLSLVPLTSESNASSPIANLAWRSECGSFAVAAKDLECALQFLKQVRRDDPLDVEDMDVLGRILFQREDTAELSKLANDALEASDSRPEGWLAAAMFSALKGEPEKAATFIEKAIQLDPKRSSSFKLKGQLHMAQSNFDQALISFSQANSLEQDITSFYGILQANIAMGKLKDAAAVAKEAIAVLPKSSSAYLMMGTVLAQTAQGVVESVKAFGKALRLDPWNKIAAASIADALSNQGKCEEAVECLTAVLSKCSCSKTRLQLAKVYSAMGKYNDAIENLHLSIGMNPKNSLDAVQEMDRIEGLLRGENYERQENDEDEDEEEEGDEDEDDDEEDYVDEEGDEV
mmetsp:Transcript_15880/g.23218  ORF Transcript_15880/g.23218 Transcript_15880/m.23218 type:complete len:637 (+) Transcript_15880:2-1912(+)